MPTKLLCPCAGQSLLVSSDTQPSNAESMTTTLEIDADSTAAYIRKVLAGNSLVPMPIAQQLANVLSLVQRL